MDALNFLTAYFLPIDAAPKGTSAWRLLEAMQSRVNGFVAACAATNLRPHFVIDAGYQSEEAATKWRKRREAEVRRHERAIPLSADTFLCDLLRAAGAPCYAAEGKDGDDIVARLAYELGPRSLILSADRDMFRYDFIRNAPDRVMADFSLRGDDPVLVALHPSPTGTPKDGVSFRTLKDVPTYEPDEWLHPHCKLHAVIHRPSHGYVRARALPDETSGEPSRHRSPASARRVRPHGRDGRDSRAISGVGRGGRSRALGRGRGGAARGLGVAADARRR